MGACNSKEPPRQGRDLSKWKVEAPASSVDDGGEATPVPTTAAARDVDVELPALNSIAFNANFHDETMCLTGWEDGTVRKLDWRSKRVVETWKPHSRAVNRLVVGDTRVYTCSRDTTVAITARHNGNGDKDGLPDAKLCGHTLNVATIAVNQEERTLCSGGRDTQTILWDLETVTATAKNTIPQNVITCSKWVPNEPLVAQGSEDLSVKIWDARSALRTPVQTYRGYIYFALSVDVSPDGNYIVTSSKGFNGVGAEVRVWDRRTGQQLMELAGHQQDATSCCFTTMSSGDSSIPFPVSVSKDGTIKAWDTAAKELLCERHEAATGMYTGVCSVSGSSRAAVLASTFSGHVHAYAFSPDSRQLVPLDGDE